MRTLFRPAISLFVLLSVICGLLYPWLTTGIAFAIFPHQARGSLVMRDGKVVGSALIAQSFSDPAHFWSRPSATTPMPYNAANSSGSNLGPSNPALIDAVKARVDALKAADPDNHALIPVDLVTASASGLDPEISIAAARYQLARVARARGVHSEQLEALVQRQAQRTRLGFMGEPRVNVLMLKSCFGFDQVVFDRP